MQSTLKIWGGLAGVTTALLISTDLCDAASVSLNPSADAFVTSGPSGNLAANNYGGAGALGVSASGLANGEFQSYLKFDLSSAKSTFDADYGTGLWSIQSITLQLTTATPNNGIFNANAAGNFSLSWTANGSWAEGSGTPVAPGSTGITFATAPSFRGLSDQALGTFSFAGGNTGANTYTLTLASGLVDDARSGSVTTMDMLASDGAVSYLVDSRSFNTGSARPVLTITAIPEPGVLSLAATGAGILLGCCGILRRKR